MITPPCPLTVIHHSSPSFTTHLVFLSAATSLLNAASCAGLGSFTFRIFTATGPCQCALYTVPNEPEPILLPMRISSHEISQSSKDSRTRLLSSFLLLDSSAERARGRVPRWMEVGEPCAEWEWESLVGDEEGEECA